MNDSHTHLYSTEFINDLPEVMQRATEKGITRFYMPAIDSSSHEKMLEVEATYPGCCFSMMGLHPCSVNENFNEELEIVENWMLKRKFAAIGEIGLDFYWDKTYTEQQYLVFKRQIGLALQYELPVVLHSRNATPETINVIREFQGKNLRGIFHCFGGTKEEADQIISLNFLLGIGGVVTYKNAGLSEVLKDISLDHMVLETDAPYLSPAPFRGKRNESSYLPLIAEKIAEIKKVSVNEVISRTEANTLNLFKEY